MLNKKAKSTKKSRERRYFEHQIERLHDDLNQKNTCVCTSVWTGSMVNGYWKEVTQMTRMGNVSKVVVGRGKRPILFRGAIVAFGNPDDREYDAVPESYFRIEVPCHAKHGFHNTAIGQPATKQTGICYTVGEESTGYIKIQWHSNKEEVWIFANRVEDTYCGKRKSNPTDRFAPTLIKHARKAISPPLNNIFYPIYKTNMTIFYSLFYKNKMKKVMKKNMKCIKDLIGLADVEWRLHQAVLMTNNLDGKTTIIRSAPRFPTLETSLIFDILRDNLHGSLGKDVNNELSIQLPEDGNDQMSPIYLDGIADWVERKHQYEREQKLSAKWIKRKAVSGMCKFPQCDANVHTAFVKCGFCYKHGPKELKKCKKCSLRARKRKGSLCGFCFKEAQNADEGDKNGGPTGLLSKCDVCLIRNARMSGGRCSHCLGMINT